MFFPKCTSRQTGGMTEMNLAMFDLMQRKRQMVLQNI